MATTSPAATAGSGEMCRLTICGPTSRVELAVPAHVPVADLMPTVLGHLDPALATSGLAHGGWVLQRLGEPPVDEDLGPAAAGLFDGDLLHLRPRDDLLPLVDFDDLVDGVHTGLSRREDRWRPALTRRVCVVVLAVCSVLAVLVAAGAASGYAVALGAGGLGLALLAGAATAGRVLGDRVSALVLAATGVGAGAIAGAAVPIGAAPPVDWLTGPGVLAAGVAVAVLAVAARFAAGQAVEACSAVAAGGVLVAAGGALSTTGLTGTGAAAVVVCTALLLTRLAPTVSARLAGLAVEPVPTSTTEFQQNLDPHPSGSVIERATRADAYLTAFLAVLGGVIAGGLVVVAAAPRWDAAAFSAAVGFLLLLHARELPGTWHRAAAMVPAAVGLAELAFVWADHLDGPWRWAGAVLLVLCAAGALAGAHSLPDRKLIPRWGRLGDIAHWVCALAVVPLALAVTGAYGAVTALFG
ncbi:type VII secretion integral membrane protein EccD [Actinokineospora bangkokensis]|uniref:Type VII secretion integral membrane protein EccD n=1 Tax=Actinokineospora bangkokensis TaxID=1193682 RepID=A0A1Q9LMS2_9PSEU|nr:type VII secretion integral membrane protein EccD [Actinokineospora bangkokensis]OLR93347.1 type VII secretion integral membrane protein EccD [Actinokineospora bangkokensis]